MGSLMRRRLLLPLVCAAIALCAVPTSAIATEVTLDELPDATHAAQIDFAPDGTLWVFGGHGTEFPGGESTFVGRWSPAGGLTEFDLPRRFQSAGDPAVADDGDYLLPGWRSGSGPSVGVIVRVSASGKTRIQAPGRRFGSVDAVAPSGDDVWFAASRYRHYVYYFTLGKIDAAGNLVARQVHLRFGCEVIDMAPGANGAVWFAESCWKHPLNRAGHRGSVGEIDPSGAIVRHPLPANYEPLSLAVGADGSVWFGETEIHQGLGSRVGRLDPLGQIAEFPLRKHDWPKSIAVGPEGDLWFLAGLDVSPVNALGSIDPAGTLAAPVCIATDCKLAPGGLTTGPDGGIWFTGTTWTSSGGGGLTNQLAWAAVANEAGYIGRLVP
jgi:hypothetical protein